MTYRAFLDTLINGASMTTNITSPSQSLDNCVRYCMQAYWSGTSPVGTITVSASNDNVNFTAISSVAVASNTGNYMVNVDNPAYPWMQVTYTYTSGTGTLTATIAGKFE